MAVVPDSRGGFRLLFVDLLGKGDIEAQKVDELAGGIDFRLEGTLAPGEHRPGIEFGPVFAGNQLGGLEEDGAALLPAKGLPLSLCRQRRIDGHPHLGGPGFMVGGEQVAVVVGHHHFAGCTGGDTLAVDDQRDLQGPGAGLGQGLFEPPSLRAVRGIGEDRFVCWGGNLDHAVIE